MTRTLEYHLTDEEVRLAVKMYIESQLSEDEVIPANSIRFMVTQGYNGEMGGSSTQSEVEVLVEIEK